MTTPISPVYEAQASATGGRDGRATTSDNKIDLKLSPPKEMGGTGEGTNPEQLFASGYSACFLGAMKFATTLDKSLPKVPADAKVTATVGIGPRPDKGFGLTVALSASLPGVDRAEAERLMQAGDEICPYSHATRGNIEVTLAVA